MLTPRALSRDKKQETGGKPLRYLLISHQRQEARRTHKAASLTSSLLPKQAENRKLKPARLQVQSHWRWEMRPTPPGTAVGHEGQADPRGLTSSVIEKE